MVNINIQINDDLHKKIKLEAINKDITLKEFIIKKLEDKIKK